MQYTISNKQQKKSANTGKEYVSATLTDEQGVEYTGINAFNGEFNTSDVWHGELQKNGNYYNLVSPKTASQSNFKAQQVEKAIERKEQGIARSQDNKDWSIRTSSTMNKAIELALAEYGKIKDETITAFGTATPLEELVLKWRRWIHDHWDDIDQFPPFN